MNTARMIAEVDWRVDAACRGMDPAIFFPERGDLSALLRAKRVCSRCPVVAECRASGTNERDGIWGGTTGRERRQQRRKTA